MQITSKTKTFDLEKSEDYKKLKKLKTAQVIYLLIKNCNKFSTKRNNCTYIVGQSI